MKKIFFCLLIASFFISGMSSAYAMTPTYENEAKFSRGVSNTCYYIDSTAETYTDLVNTAMGNWVDTGYGWNPIYATPVASNYATHIDVYGSDIYRSNVLDIVMLGHTSFWSVNGEPIAQYENEKPKSNYFYTEIEMNMSLSDSYKLLAVSHEIGHAFGLDDSTNPNSLMYYKYRYCSIQTVQKEDHDTINYLYN